MKVKDAFTVLETHTHTSHEAADPVGTRAQRDLLQPAFPPSVRLLLEHQRLPGSSGSSGAFLCIIN